MKRQTLKRIALIALSLAIYIFLILKIRSFNEWGTIFTALNYTEVALLILLQLMLMSINMLMEALKWKIMIAPTQKISICQSIESVLVAFSLGGITPARAGEHVGRLLHILKGKRSLAVAYSMISSIMQTIIIILALAVSIPNLTNNTINKLSLNWLPTYIATTSILIGALVVIAILIIKNTKYKITVARLKVQLTDKTLGIKHITSAFMLSTARYIVFATQLIIMLMVFSPQTQIAQLAWHTPLYYFLITIIPSIFLADLGIKGGVALFVFGSVIGNVPAIVISIFFIWIINSAIPTVIGNIIIIKRQLK